MDLVIVTGGSRGIGYSISKALLARGFDVHILARDATLLKSVSEELSTNRHVGWSSVDLSDKKEILDFASVWNKKIYGLVNNAGRWSQERLDEPNNDNWDHTINLNLSGTYWLTKLLLPFIQNQGRIVNISSQLGTSGRAGFGGYAASKHGVIGLTLCWALELAARQITVNAVCPGWVRTESNLRELEEQSILRGCDFFDTYRTLSESLPLGRFIEPEEVADLVSFLIGTEGSGVSGQVYHIK